jgi:DNA-binding NarL/FixJ family response regulator
MPGTLVLVHHDIAVVVDPDVLFRRAVSQRLKSLGIHALAFGSGHDAARQLLKMAPKLRAMPLSEQSSDFDWIEIWQLLQPDAMAGRRSLSVLPVLGVARQHGVRPSQNPIQVIARQLRECQRQRKAAQLSNAVEKAKVVSPAEHRVLQLLKEGISNRGIASKLCLSQRTVESHLHRLFRKLEVKNRTELALVAD